MAALVIGCMTPDLYRLFTQESIALTHQWTGVLFPDLPIGLGFCLLWYLLYRPVVYRFLGLRDGLNLNSFDHFISFSLMSCMSVVIGIATHLIWDGLTHLDFRSFAFQNTLAQNVSLWNFHYPLHFILQIASSIVTLPILWWMCRHYYQQYKAEKVSSKIRLFALISLVISGASGLVSVWHSFHHLPLHLWHTERYFLIGRVLNQFTQAGLMLFSLFCLLFLFLDRKNRF